MDSSKRETGSIEKKSISTVSSKKSRSSRAESIVKNSPKKADLESEDISLSQLELMANKKKLNKEVNNISVVSKREEIEDIGGDYRDNRKSTSISVSSSSVSTKSTRERRRKERAVGKENQDEYVRNQKSEYLCKFNKINVKGKWSSLRLDMNNSLDEIRNEYEYY
jgi:hypothetical protein